jgi:tubulin--tyrosine ligase
MLITSVNGIIKGYWYEEGYIRTSSNIYNIDNIDDRIMHLTNDAVQKRG